jgi:hypothetical protein
MAGQVIHSNVTMPERCFPIIPTGKHSETRRDVTQFGLRARGEGERPFHRAAMLSLAQGIVTSMGEAGHAARSMI